MFNANDQSSTGERPGVREHLQQEARAMVRLSETRSEPEDWRETVTARCTAADVAGVRRLRIRDWIDLGDTDEASDCWALGRSSPELFAGRRFNAPNAHVIDPCSPTPRGVGRFDLTVSVKSNDAWFFEIDQDDPRIPFDSQVGARLPTTEDHIDIEALHRHVTESSPWVPDHLNCHHHRL